eukprot:TRINITY_DN6831_c0_g6_i1.p1 TRINITY_DN6831_c0_g6~~TRINITY_DN6831_c0_g6_i1.p1  ORF type:complete len:327 (+),score=78.23 TRINITY_DN6831_c0_g6_i1:206-1186(+)
MFPASNIHYKQHYDIGYANIPFVNETEYQLRYPEHSTRNALKGKNLNQSMREDLGIYEQSCGVIKDLREEHCDREMMEEERRLEAKYKENLKKQLDKWKEQMTYADKAKAEKLYESTPEYNCQYDTTNSHKDPYANCSKPQTTLIQEEINGPKKSDEANLLNNDYECKANLNESYNLPSEAKLEDAERKTRVRKYKEYLDLQIKLKNEKLQYERSNKMESNKLTRMRNSELRRVEQETLARDRALKDRLAEAYKRQMAEQSVLRKGRSMDHSDQNNFCGLMDVNRRRYLKVSLMLTLAIGCSQHEAGNDISPMHQQYNEIQRSSNL